MSGEPSHFELGVPDDERGRARRAEDSGPEKPGERGPYAGCTDDQGVAFGLHQPG